MQTNNLREIFNAESRDLNEKMQVAYATAREFAQLHNWKKHIDFVKDMLPVVAYLEQTDLMARLLGRLAWSYIRLEEKKMATQLLSCSKEYDLWQSAANYFWACEYSRRQRNMTDYANECLTGFRESIKQIPDFATIKLPVDDLELAVLFYDKLIVHEEKSDVFLNKSSKSDVARYHELNARLTQNPAEYELAEEYYRDAGLQPYATCCEALRLMHEADEQKELTIKKDKFHTASEALKKGVFMDDYIRVLLIKFNDLREAFCDLYIGIETDETIEATSILDQITNIEKIYKTGDDSLHKLSLKVPSFYVTAIYTNFRQMMHDLLITGKINFYDSNEILKIDTLLEKVQKQLPSYTFSISKQEI
ncbi:MAG: hypothetical protein FWC30_01210 [Candidatus Bathyarchaeota archaeon]|nr:hypothetical protein [Candidatus Termiticorpusculum sp.]